MTLRPALVQAVVVLVSMGTTFYASHPLGHFLTAKAYGVGTRYFFVGRSDFGKLESKPMAVVASLLPTIGTKLNKSELASIPPKGRGRIFGAGVIFSTTLMAIQSAYVFIMGFNLLAIVFALLFFGATLATEFLFSTKVGDLAKMAAEYKKAHSP